MVLSIAICQIRIFKSMRSLNFQTMHGCSLQILFWVFFTFQGPGGGGKGTILREQLYGGMAKNHGRGRNLLSDLAQNMGRH